MLILDQLRRHDLPLRLLAWSIVAGLAILFGGLWYVQVMSARRYHESQRNQSFRMVRLPALRGKVLDRSGTVIAENRPGYSVSLYLEERALRQQIQKTYRTEISAARAAAKAAGRKLTRADTTALARSVRYRVASNTVFQLGQVIQEPVPLLPRTFQRHYEERLALPLPVLGSLTSTQKARFLESSSLPPGLDLELQPTRHYPFQSVAAHVLGYLTRDESGQEFDDTSFNYRLPDFTGSSGVEAAFNTELRGQPGAKSVLVNNLGYRQAETIWSPVEPGLDVHLTLDIGLQRTAEQALSQVRGTNTRGAVVVLDVRDGDILALVSSPAFNPNHFIPRLTFDEWRQFTNEATKPLLNRAVYGAYPPGSIFKIITGMAALEAGWDPARPVRSPGYAMVGRRRVDDTAPAGEYDFRRAFKLSSNKYFIDAGLFAGADRILEIGEQFCLGQRTGVPLRPETPAILPTREWQRRNRVEPWFDGDTANLSIGQGDLSVTPLQMAVMTAAVANGGRILTPRLVDRIQSPDPLSNLPVRHFPAGLIRGQLAVGARTLEEIRTAMIADVEDRDGTGRRAAVPGYRVGGKTGTAQVTQGRRVVDHITWFVSYAPVEDPHYAVVVMVESGDSGGGTCAPVARRIFEQLKQRDEALAARGGDLVSTAGQGDAR